MSYFQQFPIINYLGHNISDITIRVSILKSIIENSSAYELYRIKNGDRLEDLAHKLYGDSQLLWVIMLVNNIIDPFYDWPMNDIELNEFVSSKYGAPFVNAIHHYEDVDGREVPASTPNATIITNFEYEDKENEKTREIRIIKGEYIPTIVRNFNTIMRNINNA